MAAALAGVPLAIFPWGHNPFGPAKLAVLLGAAAATGAGLALAPTAERGRALALVRSKAGWAAAAYFGFLGLSFITAVDRGSALTGGYPGYAGVVAMACFAVTGVGAAALSAREGGYRTLGRAVVFALIVVSAYSLLQRLGLDPVTYREGLDLARARSTLGNASNLGLWLTLALPHCVERAVGDDSRAWRAAAWTGLIAGGLALAWTASRGAWAGVAVGTLVFAVLGWRAGVGDSSRRVVALAGLAVALGIGAGLLSTPGAVARVPALLETGGTGAGRVLVWRSTSSLIADRPFLGWGQAAYVRVFPAYADPGLADDLGRTQALDDPHNALLSAAAAAGVPAALALAAVWVLLGIALWRTCGRDAPSGLRTAAFGASLAGGVIALQFHFLTLDTGPLLFAVSGLVAAEDGARTGALAGGSVRTWRWAWTAAACVLALASLGAFALVRADALVREGFSAARSGAPWEETHARFVAARRSAPWEPALWWAEGSAATAWLSRRPPEGGGASTGIGDSASAGRTAFAEAERRMPGDARIPRDLGDMLVAEAIAVGYGAAPAEQAVAAYERALLLAPTDAAAWIGLGSARLVAGNAAGATEALERGVSLVPGSPAAWRNLAESYRALGRDLDAAEADRRAAETGPERP